MLNVFACKCVVWTLSFDLSAGKVWILWLIFLNFSLLFFWGGGAALLLLIVQCVVTNCL